MAIDVLHHLDKGSPVLTELLRVVRPGGTVVLADFSAEGFEMVSRVYAADGLVHTEGPVTLDWARGFLIDRAGHDGAGAVSWPPSPGGGLSHANRRPGAASLCAPRSSRPLHGARRVRQELVGSRRLLVPGS